jgi:pyruvate ferredoxin oxidoreductase alpha subunit
MGHEDLTPELKGKVLSCKTTDEPLALAETEGYQLSDEELDSLSGGELWGSECAPVCGDRQKLLPGRSLVLIELLEDAPVRDFVGTYQPEEFLLNPGKPVAVGPYSVSNYAMEAKKAQEDAMEQTGQVILEVAERFEKMSGRSYGFFEEYRTEDADYIMLIMGSAAGTAKAAVDQLREEGWKVGVLKLRVFRPFPEKQLAEALGGCRALAIMDRCESYNGCCGPLGMEVPAALYRNKVLLEAVNYIYGLAGRDFTVEHVRDIFAELREVADGRIKAPQHKYINLRSE